MRRKREIAAPPGIGNALGTMLAALLFTGALAQTVPARAGQHGGGFQGGFHGGGFHGGFAGRPHGEFHARGFHGGGFFHHRGFHRGIVIAPALGGLWLGAGLGWPYYSYPYESYYPPGAQYWYCENPPGYYPSVNQCSTDWQMVPGN